MQLRKRIETEEGYLEHYLALVRPCAAEGLAFEEIAAYPQADFQAGCLER
jgi:hypothetical protein